ncbi:MAG: hypothetical protein JM58_00985 [Peptococcaceae bacterium BICA1-8]|nr:MAG: hypothetical protein JM58_00985 [Peptococcaceae bacterium BICA1-8]
MLLIDIGSTYTKLVVADCTTMEIIASDCSPTTIEDVSIGFHKALKKIEDKCVPAELLEERYASSSAAGGLRMIAIGLVPELTMEAANRAALGAGAKVIKTYSFNLSKKQVKEIEDLRPDIILLAGGTDGGEKNTIIHNAKMIVESSIKAPVIMAGNSAAADSILDIFEQSNKPLYVTENVMPFINKLNVDSVKEIIREIFIKKIVVAKGLSKINDFIKGIALPTPLAVLEAAKTMADLFSEGVVLVDVGGATTDVHSITDGLPCDPQIVLKGLPEPFAKRTVEGDLGVRHNISSIVDAVGKERLLKNANVTDAVDSNTVDIILGQWASEASALPKDYFEKSIDCGLAISAVEVATDRHAGYLEEIWTPAGKILVQYGKDLSLVGAIIGTGGPVINSERPWEILEKATYSNNNPFVLKPKKPKYYVDSSYVVFSIGLIAQINPKAAKEIAQNYLKKMEVKLKYA